MLTYSFSERGGLSLYEYLYRCIRADIESGGIAPNEKLPSKRAFARHLGVSLITIEAAYAQLLAEGYVRSEPRRGYYACDLGVRSSSRRVGSEGALAASGAVAPSTSPASSAPESASSAFKPAVSASKPLPSSSESLSDEALPIDLTGASVPTGLFPYGTWAKSVRQALTCEPEQDLIGPTDAFGMLKLRQALAEYLYGFRGMEVNPANIVIGAGSQVLDNLLVQLLGRGLRYGVEDPGYPRLTQIYRANGVELAHLPLDDAGVDMSALGRAGVNVLHLTPSHQYPTGLVTSIARRYELLLWAEEGPNRYLIEDDYDCEFRLAGRPIPTLAGIDYAGRVIHMNTFAKSLGPAFRVGYMVLPDALAKRFRDELGFYSCTVSAIDQLALARFIAGGEYERHLNRMRTHYRGVRDALLAALRGSMLGEHMRVYAQDAGIHFVLGLQAGEASVVGVEWDKAFEAAALAQGVCIKPVSSFYQAAIPERENGAERKFVVSYGGVQPSQAVSVAEALSRAYDSLFG